MLLADDIDPAPTADVEPGVWEWAAVHFLICLLVWTPLWLRRYRQLRRESPEASAPGPDLAIYLVTLNHMLLLFAAWWGARLAVAFLFPSGPMNLVASLVVYFAVNLTLMTRLGLTFGPTPAAFSRLIREAWLESHRRLVLRELLAFLLGLHLLFLADLLIPLAPGPDEEATWDLWEWCVRWLILTAVPVVVEYITSGNWKLAVRKIDSKPLLVLYFVLLLFVQLILTGRTFMMFAAWWFARSLAEPWLDQGILFWSIVVVLTGGYFVLLRRSTPTAQRGPSPLFGHGAVAQRLLDGGVRVVLVELTLVLLHLAMLFVIVAGTDEWPVATVGLVVLLTATHALARRRPLPPAPEG